MPAGFKVIMSGDNNDRPEWASLIDEKYHTKDGGAEWYMDMENFDKQKNIKISKDELTKEQGGKYWNGTPDTGMNPDSFRVTIYPKDGSTHEATKNHKEASERGYMASPSDWKNVEFTAYL